MGELVQCPQVNRWGRQCTLPADPSHTKHAFAKRAKRLSRVKRWQAAVDDAQKALAKLQDARSEIEAAFAELVELKEEFEAWRDNLEDRFERSALREKLDTICDLEIDPDETDLEKIEEIIAEAESADLPLGFGRD